MGTALNANPDYVKSLAPTLSEISKLPLIKADDLVDGTQNLDAFAYVSSVLKTCAISCSKMSNDFRLMSSGPRCGFEEINLPAKQNGSSIMPGKVNPVIPEVMSQAAFCIIGNDMCITMAAEAGQLELNFAEPVLYHKLFESIVVFTGAVKTFTENCVSGITANVERCRELVDNSVGLGIPFILSAVLIDYLKSAFNWIKKNYKIINIISGVLLVLIGVLMATGTFGRLLGLLS